MIWRSYLILCPAELDLEQWTADSTGGAHVLCRDVLAGPPAYEDEDPADPEGTVTVQPGAWTDGYHSQTPGLALATAAHFGKRRGVVGRLGARIYFGRLPGTVLNWLARAQDVADGIDLAAASGLWTQPELVLVLRKRDPAFVGLVESLWPGAVQRFIPVNEATPARCAAEIGGAV